MHPFESERERRKMEVDRSWLNIFSAEEISVAETLATLLPVPVTKVLSSSSDDECFGSPLIWGRKKRRSATTLHVSWPRQRHTKAAEGASSPATPLSFSPATESDDKLNPAPLPSNSTLKRKSEQVLKTIQDLKKDNELLTAEMKNVQCYYERLKDFNSKLKAMKLELSGGPDQRAPPPQIHESEEGAAQQQQEARCGQQTTSLVVAPSSGSDSATSRRNSDMGPSPIPSPIEIPDLNLPFEVEKHDDMNRTLAAEAR